MAQMLAMVVNERRGDWDWLLPHVEYASNNSVSAATSLAQNEVYIGRLSRLSLTIFIRTDAVGHQSTARDYGTSCAMVLSIERTVW